MNYLRRVWLFVFLLGTCGSTLAADNIFFAHLANRDHFLTFELTSQDSRNVELLSDEPRIQGVVDHLADTLILARARRTTSVTTIPANLGGVIWDRLTPAGDFAAFAYADGFTTKRIVVVRTSDMSAIGNIDAKNYVADALWLDSGRTLAVLEYSERTRYDLPGILSFLSGHPVPIDSFHVRLYSIPSMTVISDRPLVELEAAVGTLSDTAALQTQVSR